MENNHNDNEKENKEKRNSSTNAEYLLTKSRITKPPPPKPATNPLQFIKVAPCPLFQKAHEQIKKVEEIKKEQRKEVREEAEDWQQNLDNWKSCRRKRQEHIIERVVEVKKLEQEEQERNRRKSKTFSEMIEDRSRGRHKFNIPIYDDDSNDLSDYGIGSSSSKTNSIKDVDTDDSCSILDEKDHNSFDSPCNNNSNSSNNKDISSSTSNQSQSEEDETNNSSRRTTTNLSSSYSSNLIFTTSSNNNNNNNNNNNSPLLTKSTSSLFNVDSKLYTNNDKVETEQYTYEGAIQDYRSRIRSRIHVDESIFTKNQQDYIKSKEFSEAQNALPKGEIFKRKELFETTTVAGTTSRRLSDDFANTQSIKQRLQSLERCTTDQQQQTIINRNVDDNKNKDLQQSALVKQRLQNFNNNNNKLNEIDNIAIVSTNNHKSKHLNKIISNNSFEEEPNNNNWRSNKIEETITTISDRCSSPETELYMNKLNMFNKDLDNLMFGKSNNNNNNNLMDNDYCFNYPPSTSSTDLMGGILSDREDSGIHTADVSCSVSQADEPVEDTDTIIIPNCIEKKPQQQLLFESKSQIEVFSDELSSDNNKEIIVNSINDLLESLRKDSSDNLINATKNLLLTEPISSSIITYNNENIVEFPSIDNNLLVDGSFPLQPSTLIEPPKVKPPPPPIESPESEPLKRLNSTKRIKKEIHIKRSSFLGLDEPTDKQIYPDIPVDKPPDINMFLQKESKLEKSLYKKIIQDDNRIVGSLSKVESQDSGLDIDRGRLSSDTWCSSTGDSSTPTHERQDSEQTNSVTSEEDEITKKEREIIEMIEKEEKSRDIIESSPTTVTRTIFTATENSNHFPEQSLSDDKQFSSQKFNSTNYLLDDQDSEVLKVEHELRQLEREELERQRENMLFQESRVKARLKNNRHSLENICDDIMYPMSSAQHTDLVNYRQSMPELPQQIPLEYRKSLPDVPNAAMIIYNNSNNNNNNYNQQTNNKTDLDVQYRKSMPDIQHAYHKLIPSDYCNNNNNCNINTTNKIMTTQFDHHHRKSMPELLELDVQNSAFKKIPSGTANNNNSRQPIMPGKPLRPPPPTTTTTMMMKNEQKDQRFSVSNNNNSLVDGKSTRQLLTRSSFQALSAVPKRPISNDNMIQPRVNPEVKSYNQHWLYQEAELRRISDQQQKNATSTNKIWQHQQQQSKQQDKHLPDAVIHTLTQRVQNRSNTINNDRTQLINNSSSRRNDVSSSGLNAPPAHHPYLGQSQTMGPMPYLSSSTSLLVEENQDRMLSVSGKKKCSYCNNELGRGAAMIIESLCLFYHMECFKCCVCHVQLGDGLMGTDVRVRNQKLHCHNCYSSDDGVKFSCV